MRNMTESELTDVVVERYSRTPDERLREIMHALIHHAHAFVRETRLTESEWIEGVEFLRRTGQLCDGKRHEMILLSDNLGISALVNLVAAAVPQGATESTVLGPFYVPNSPKREWGESVLLRESNETPLILYGMVCDVRGTPIPGATIEVWQTDSNGMYDIQDGGQPGDNLRGCYTTRDTGEFLIRTIRPTSYPIPTDGTVGELLRATARHPWRPAHLHAVVSAPGFNPLTTHLFDADDKHLDSDVVFAVKESLIRKFEYLDDARRAAEFGIEAPFWFLENNFVLVERSQ
jgi:protocatechuate 3,4-dioxygenase beta subunit